MPLILCKYLNKLVDGDIGTTKLYSDATKWAKELWSQENIDNKLSEKEYL
jgi:hypothetical protein